MYHGRQNGKSFLLHPRAIRERYDVMDGVEGERGKGYGYIIVIRSQSSDWFTHGWSLKALSSDTGESHSMNH